MGADLLLSKLFSISRNDLTSHHYIQENRKRERLRERKRERETERKERGAEMRRTVVSPKVLSG